MEWDGQGLGHEAGRDHWVTYMGLSNRSWTQGDKRWMPTGVWLTFLLLLVFCGVGFANHGPYWAQAAKKAFKEATATLALQPYLISTNSRCPTFR